MSEERIKSSPFVKFKQNSKGSRTSVETSDFSKFSSSNVTSISEAPELNSSIQAHKPIIQAKTTQDQQPKSILNTNGKDSQKSQSNSVHLEVPKKPQKPKSKDPLYLETLFQQDFQKNDNNSNNNGEADTQSKSTSPAPSRSSTPHFILTKVPDQTHSKTHNDMATSFDILAKTAIFADSNANAIDPSGGNNNNPEKFQNIYPYNQQSPLSNINNPALTIQTEKPKIPYQRPINRPLKNSWRGKLRRFLKKGRRPISFLSFKRIVKCSLAFFFASLMVLIQPIHNWIGPYSLLAPITTVWFDSNRTAGAQLEFFFICLLFYLAGFIYFLIMLGFYILYNRNYIVPSNDPSGIGMYDGSFVIILFTIVLIFTCGFIRAKYPKLLMPSVQLMVTCINIVANYPIGAVDFNIQFISNIFVPCLIGLFISLTINIILWPESASQDLTEALFNSLTECHKSLELLTSTFLLEPATSAIQIKYLKEAQENCVRSVGILSRAGKDARYETTRSIHPPRDFKGLIRTLTTLSQHLSGLSNAVQRQRELLQMGRPEGIPITPVSSEVEEYPTMRSLANSLNTSQQNSISMDNDDPFLYQLQRIASYRDSTLDRGLIHDVVRIIRGPFLELSATCLNVLELGQKAATDGVNQTSKNPITNLFSVFKRKKKSDVESGNNSTHDSLDAKYQIPLTLEEARNQLPEIIAKYERTEGKSLKFVQSQLMDNNDKVSAYPEPVLIVFSGLFSMREVAKELVNVIKAAEEFHKRRPPIIIRDHKWWNFTWGERSNIDREEKESKRIKKLWLPRVPLTKYFKNPGSLDTMNEKTPFHQVSPDTTTMMNHTDTLRSEVNTTPVSENSDDVEEKDRFRAISLWIWKASQRLKQYDVKYGVKTTILVMILLFPSFFPQWSEFWRLTVHGAWASTAAVFVLNTSLGGTLYMGLIRIIGTTIGAIWGYLSALVHLHFSSVYLTSLMVWMFIAPAWYIVVTTKLSAIGMSSLLAYCIVLFLQVYPTGSLVSPAVMATIHAANVVVGVIAALFIGAFLWPYIAHRELRLTLASIVGQLGISYGQVSALCMIDRTSDEWMQLNIQSMHNQRRIQKHLLRARNLLPFATREPRLRAPFPTKLYRHQLYLLQAILDQLVSMRTSTIGLTPQIQHKLIIPFNLYRKHIVSAVIHYFHLLSGALRSKQPLPPCPPPIYAMQNHFRQFIAKSINKKSDRGHETLKSPPFSIIYWYSYMASQSQLLNDLLHLGQNMGKLVGELELPFTDPNFLNYENGGNNECRFDLPDQQTSPPSEISQVHCDKSCRTNGSGLSSNEQDSTFNEEYNDESLNRMDPKGNGIW